MRYSVCVDTSRPWAEVAALAKFFDSEGWACIYVPDHFIRSDGDGRTMAGGMLEAWTTLAALASTTARVELGTLVLSCSYRHPAVVANMAATLDQVSGGRLVLGLGAGGQANEHKAYGIDLSEPSDRLDRLGEAAAVISSLLTNPQTNFSGRWYRLVDAACEPKPLRPKLPILVGGRSKRTMTIAARFALVWHAWGTPGELSRMNATLDEVCREVGRDPGTLRRASGGSHPEDALSLIDAGFDELIWRDNAQTDVDDAIDQARRFALLLA